MEYQHALENLIALDIQVRLYVPSTIDVDVDADTQAYVDKTVGLLSGLFGGATAYNARGGWYDGTKVVYERVTIVESYTTSDNLDEHIDSVIAWAQAMKTELRQQAIAIEIGGKLYLL